MNPQLSFEKDCHKIDVDRISNLPNDVISNILSRLPTIDVVGTCILSKTWEHKWKSIPNIDIDDAKRYYKPLETRDSMFIKFIERTLLHTQNARSIRFKLIYKYESSLVASWIHTLLSHNDNVEILRIYISSSDFVLSSSLLNSNSLKELILSFHSFKVPTVNCFPNLTILRLDYVKILNENSITNSTLVFNFPVLKEIRLDCTWLVNLVEIHAPALNCYSSYTSEDAEVDGCTINILGARLERFHTRQYSLENFLLTRTTTVFASLTNVAVDDDQETLQKHGFRVRNILNGFSSTLEHLEISHFLVEAILESKLGFPPLPTLDKLGRLFLCDDNWNPPGRTEAVFELLHATPFLKILAIEVDTWCEHDYDAVERVPSCIISYLEEVHLKSVYFEIPEDLTKFWLKTGAKLKRFHYEILNNRAEDVIMKELSAFPRASTDLTITVSTRKGGKK